MFLHCYLDWNLALLRNLHLVMGKCLLECRRRVEDPDKDGAHSNSSRKQTHEIRVEERSPAVQIVRVWDAKVDRRVRC